MWLILLACSQSIKDSGTQSGSTEAEADTVYTATLKIYDAFSGQALSGVSTIGDLAGDASTTDESGQSTTGVSSNYHIEMTAEGYPPHHYMGQADTDFELIALLAEESLSAQIYTMLSIPQDASKGVLVVALDKPDLSPAVGASASIDANMSQAFVLGSTGPSFGTTITSSASSVVTFPNMSPGEVQITAINSTGDACTSFPSGDDSPQSVSVFESAVTVAVYTCQ